MSAQKVELCRSEIFLFIGSKHPIIQSNSGSDEEGEKEEKEALPLSTLSDSVSTSESEEEIDYHSAATSSLPSSESEEGTESDSSIPLLISSGEEDEDEEEDEEEENSESESLPGSRPKVQKLPLERTDLLWKTAKKLYVFSQAYDHFYASVIFNVIQFAVVSLETDAFNKNQHFVKSLPCFLEKSWSWFLVNAYVKDMYFTIQKGNVDEKFKLTGI
jgi:hypothetical protein